MRRVVVIFVLGLVGFAGPQVASSARAADPSAEAAFVAKINALRASKGLGQLTVDAGLTQIGRDWSQQMANAGGISHNLGLKDLVTANWSNLGENVGMGPNVDSLFTAFVNSPHHYENLVDPTYTHVGVGVINAGTTMYTSHEFMALRGGPAPTTAPAPRVTAPPTPRTTAAPRPTVPRAAPKPVVQQAPAPPPPPPPPPPVPDRVRLSWEILRSYEPAA